jgi:8-oxo-dGTP pyrophosphatase MutT (NUDIX family)
MPGDHAPAESRARRLRRLATRVALRVAFVVLSLSSRVFHPITLGVRVMLIRDGRVLLVRHTYRAGWFLPGGGMKKNESVAGAARREAHEEAGATLATLDLFGIYSNFSESKSDHMAVFISTDFQLTGEHDDEIARIEWFPLDALPPDASPGTRDRIAEYLAGGAPFARDWQTPPP